MRAMLPPRLLGLLVALLAGALLTLTPRPPRRRRPSSRSRCRRGTPANARRRSAAGGRRARGGCHRRGVAPRPRGMAPDRVRRHRRRRPGLDLGPPVPERCRQRVPGEVRRRRHARRRRHRSPHAAAREAEQRGDAQRPAPGHRRARGDAAGRVAHGGGRGGVGSGARAAPRARWPVAAGDDVEDQPRRARAPRGAAPDRLRVARRRPGPRLGDRRPQRRPRHRQRPARRPGADAEGRAAAADQAAPPGARRRERAERGRPAHPERRLAEHDRTQLARRLPGRPRRATAGPGQLLGLRRLPLPR